ncbi:hypothetical protein KC356_g48 [Hortaea werneckii]|nr:hypothetical protein KC356_g48 [Hortaea werneckii]
MGTADNLQSSMVSPSRLADSTAPNTAVTTLFDLVPSYFLFSAAFSRVAFRARAVNTNIPTPASYELKSRPLEVLQSSLIQNEKTGPHERYVRRTETQVAVSAIAIRLTVTSLLSKDVYGTAIAASVLDVCVIALLLLTTALRRLPQNRKRTLVAVGLAASQAAVAAVLSIYVFIWSFVEEDDDRCILHLHALAVPSARLGVCSGVRCGRATALTCPLDETLPLYSSGIIDAHASEAEVAKERTLLSSGLWICCQPNPFTSPLNESGFIRLEPIPGSRPVSPAKPLDGPFPETSPEETPLPESPIQSVVSSPWTQRASSDELPPLRRPSTHGSQVHPLFRAESPMPPPLHSPGTVITASPYAGQIIGRDHAMSPRHFYADASRNGSARSLQTAAASPTPDTHQLSPLSSRERG